MMISEVFNIDCVEYMKTLPDKFFDLAIVDPPYGINATDMQMGSAPNRSKNDGYGSGPSISTAAKLKGRLNQGSGKLKNRILNKSSFDWDNAIPTTEYFEQLFRCSVNQIIWGGNYFPLPPTRGIICWDKMQPWENFSQWEMAWTSFDKPAAIIRLSNTGGANTETKFHPTQKQVKLYKWLMAKRAQPGMKIFDSHMDSGSSRIAAHDMGLDYYGCEINSEYFEKSNKWYKINKSQLKLF